MGARFCTGQQSAWYVRAFIISLAQSGEFTLRSSTDYGVTSQRPSTERLRVAIIATPRSGTTWFRALLAKTYALSTFAVRSPSEIQWEQLPERCVLSMHWHPEPQFVRELQQHGFRVVTTCRHPLDVLISILHFASAQFNAREHTAHWLLGEGGDESAIVDALPTSARFVEYALSPRAKALFSVSPEWSALAGTLTVPYEVLLRDTSAELTRVTSALEPVSPTAIQSAIESNHLSVTRSAVKNHHNWQGIAGNWKRLFPAALARQIMACHRGYSSQYEYVCDPDESLEEVRAVTNWLGLEAETIKSEQRETTKVTCDDVANLYAQIEALRAELEALKFPTVANGMRRCLRAIGLRTGCR